VEVAVPSGIVLDDDAGCTLNVRCVLFLAQDEHRLDVNRKIEIDVIKSM
jgi:hypothetical protein